MEYAPKRPGSITFLLVGLVLLITAAGLFAAIVPLVQCPSCQIGVVGFVFSNGEYVPVDQVESKGGGWLYYKDAKGARHRAATSDIVALSACERCKGRKKVTLLNRCIK